MALLAMAMALPAAATPAPTRGGDVARADSLRLIGRYADARRAFSAMAGDRPLVAALGTARCQAATGETEPAIETLRSALAKAGVRGASGQPDRAVPGSSGAPTARSERAALHAELAWLEFERGRHDAARAQVGEALASDPDQCAARFLAAELHRVAGRLAEADEAYRWLVRYYNRARDGITDPEVLLWIGRGAAQYARWNRNSGQFGFLVNTLYPRARRLDPNFWPAHLEAAQLFIEKYNPVDAAAELDSALAINPGAAELHAAAARVALERGGLDSARAAAARALAINPRLKAAHHLQADLELSLLAPIRAIAILERAREIDPLDEETLGRLAAAYGAVDGLRCPSCPAGSVPGVAADTTRPSRLRSVMNEALRRNPHCGGFFASLAEGLDRLRKYPSAAAYYEEARRRMPQLASVPGSLGMVWMRLGEEARARELLDEAFKADPFNARVKNTLDVLDLLEGYGTIETAHFVVRYDRRDSLLAKYAARHLEEEVYAEVTGRLGFRPTGKSLFEIFSSSGGTSAQGWFAARMAGLPFLGPVAACAGKIVGMVSPNDTRSDFNWARTLRHEFVHVVNLQQTDFNIPHWFTEGLAVHHEDAPRPPDWDVILARRAAAGTLFTLDNINLGFMRPGGNDWTLAYCQAELYAGHIASAYGREALNRLIAAYGENLDTPRALERCCGVRPDALDASVRKEAEAIAAAVPPAERAEPPRISDLERTLRRDPTNADALAQTAAALLDAGQSARAEERAAKALEIRPRHPLATWVMARVRAAAGRRDEALTMLKAAVDLDAPEPRSLGLLAELTRERGDHAEAERLARIGAGRFPHSSVWPAALAAVHEASRDTAKLMEALVRLSEMEENDAAPRERLARIARARGDTSAAAAWAKETLHIDVLSVEAHAILAATAAGGGRFERAAEEYETAILLGGKRQEWLLELARACARTNRDDRAREALRDLLETDPEYPGARELLRTLR